MDQDIELEEETTTTTTTTCATDPTTTTSGQFLLYWTYSIQVSLL